MVVYRCLVLTAVLGSVTGSLNAQSHIVEQDWIGHDGNEAYFISASVSSADRKAIRALTFSSTSPEAELVREAQRRQQGLRAERLQKHSAFVQAPSVVRKSKEEWNALLLRYFQSDNPSMLSEVLAQTPLKALLAAAVQSIGPQEISELKQFTVYSSSPLGAELKLDLSDSTIQKLIDLDPNYVSVLREYYKDHTFDYLRLVATGIYNPDDVNTVRLIVQPTVLSIAVRVELLDGSNHVVGRHYETFGVAPEAPPGNESEPSVAFDNLPDYFASLVTKPIERFPFSSAGDYKLRASPFTELTRALQDILPTDEPLFWEFDEAQFYLALTDLKDGRLAPKRFLSWALDEGYLVKIPVGETSLYVSSRVLDSENGTRLQTTQAVETSLNIDYLTRDLYRAHREAGFPYYPTVSLNTIFLAGTSSDKPCPLPYLPMRSLLGSLSDKEWDELQRPEGVQIFLDKSRRQFLLELFENYEMVVAKESEGYRFAQVLPSINEAYMRAGSLTSPYMSVEYQGRKIEGSPRDVGNIVGQLSARDLDSTLPELVVNVTSTEFESVDVSVPCYGTVSWVNPVAVPGDYQHIAYADLEDAVRQEFEQAFRHAQDLQRAQREAIQKLIRP